MEIFFFETPPKNCTNMLFFLIFLHIPIDLWVEASENWIFRLKVLSRVCTVRPKLGVFSKMFKIQLFCFFITQHMCAIFRGCLKKKCLHFSGTRDCLLCGVPYIYIFTILYIYRVSHKEVHFKTLSF